MELIIAVGCFILIYIAQGRIYKKWWDKNLDVDISFSEECIEACGRSCIIETINNAKKLPLTVLHVKFSAPRCFAFKESENSNITDLYHRNDAFSVMGNTQVIRKLEFTAEKRGLYFISGVNVVAKDFFMTKTFAAHIENRAYVYVFPRKVYNDELNIVFNTIFGDIISNKSLYEDPFTFRGIREYTSTDNMRSINWKASARHDDLLVNIYDRTSDQKVRIFLCLEPHVMIKTEYMEELCISMAAAAAEFFINRQIPVMILSNGIDILSGGIERVDFGTSKDHMNAVNKYLARINKNAGLETFLSLTDDALEENDTNISNVIISSYYKEDLLERLDAMIQKGMHVDMITPYLNIRKFDGSRNYIHGMEVSMDET